MKTIKKRLLAILLSLSMVFAMLPALSQSLTVYADEANPITVYLTVSLEGKLASASDGSLMAWKPVQVKDLDKDGKFTFDEALIAAHASYNKADGYDAGASFPKKLWGIDTGGSSLFYINDEGISNSVTQDTVKNGDCLVASYLTDRTYWSDMYSFFDQRTISAEAGEPFELTLKGFPMWPPDVAPIADATVGYYSKDGIFTSLDLKTDTTGKVKISLDPGIYYISATSSGAPLIASCCIAVVSDNSFTASANGNKLSVTDFQEDAYSYMNWGLDEPALQTTDLFLVTVPKGTETVDLKFSTNLLAYNYDEEGNYVDGYYEDYHTGASTATVSIDADGNGATDYISVQTPYYSDPNAKYGETSDILYVITFAYDETVNPSAPEDVSADLEEIYADTQEKVLSIVSGDGNAFDKQWFAMDLSRDYVYNEDRAIIPYADGSFTEEYVNEIIDKKGVLHTGASDYTNYAKAILTLTSLGIDASNVDGINLVEKLADKTSVAKQGLNGVIYALLALDCAPYDLDGSDELRDHYVTQILNTQLTDGGWDWANKKADPDMTAMALQALAPYYNSSASVKIAVDKALITLSCSLQQADGGFQTEDAAYAESSESTAMVILALLALGIDPATDERFVKEGGSTIDNLCSFAVAGGGFKHTADGGYNGLATDQCYRALVGYFRMLANKTTVYDMSDMAEDDSLISVKGHLHEELSIDEYKNEAVIKQVSAFISKNPTIAAMNGTVVCLVDAYVFLYDEKGQFVDVVSYTKTDKEVEVKIPADKLSQLGDKIIIAGVHNNEIIIIEPTSVDRKTGVVKFKTDRFSFYAVVTNSAAPVPATGDNANMVLWIVLMGAAILTTLSVVVIVRRKKLHR